MITVRIKGLLLHARHGVEEQERSVGNEFRVDIDMECGNDAERGAELDDLSLTVNYAEAIDLVKREMAIPSALLENVAVRIGRAIADRFRRVEKLRVEVTKLTPPCGVQLTEGVSAVFSWSR